MDGVKRIIDEAYLFENPDEVKVQQQLRHENIKEANRMAQHDFQIGLFCELVWGLNYCRVDASNVCIVTSSFD